MNFLTMDDFDGVNPQSTTSPLHPNSSLPSVAGGQRSGQFAHARAEGLFAVNLWIFFMYPD